jgi:hypothetical protein
MGRAIMNRIKRLAHIPYIAHIKIIKTSHNETIYYAKAKVDESLAYAPVQYEYIDYRWTATRVSKAKRRGGRRWKQ